MSQERHLVVLVVDAEPLPQVSEHHGTVLFELKATRQVFSENNRGTVRPHWSFHREDGDEGRCSRSLAMGGGVICTARVPATKPR